jgi:uncharacterized protein YqfA (UPF0365 family)
MKGSKHFEGIIKAYLDRYATRDEVFAEKYRNSTGKSIEECCAYIASEVLKMGVNGLDDIEVFGLAVHYYDEKEVKIEKTENYQYLAVCNHKIELTEEEKEEAKAKAMEQYQQQLIAEMRSKCAKKETKKTPTALQQATLFD